MSTALNEIPGWYIEFQAALLRQAPRPGEIDQMTAERWTRNQWGLKKNLANCLLSKTSVPAKLVEVTETGSEGAVIPTAPTTTAWTVDDEGNIHFTLTSNGFTREQWEQHLERRGWRIGGYARQVLRLASEAPTNGVTYNIVVRPGKKISDSDRITKKIRVAADKKGWVKPHWEVACLIRDTFTDEQLEQMGLWYIVTMHEPIKDSGGDPSLLGSYRYDGGRWLGASYDRPDDYWRDFGGFAFAVPQVGSQT